LVSHRLSTILAEHQVRDARSLRRGRLSPASSWHAARGWKEGVVPVELEGCDLPGRRCGPDPEGRWYENIHVGPRGRREPVDLVPGDAPSARWEFDVTVRIAPDGAIDFAGPFVHGKRGERCLYLSWGEVGDDGGFDLFRAAKLTLVDVDPAVVRKR
jgi:hypothetical protein